ncbi:MAG TPA: hypothetical protein VMU77_02555 [Acidimicrobiales bacterium]|nr:hypothetical protein [Acidimicrobiales bacterium]
MAEISEDISWDNSTLDRVFKTGLNPAGVRESIESYCRRNDWEVEEDHLVSSTARLRTTSSLKAESWPKSIFFNCVRRVTCREKLEPLTQEARSRMSAWVLFERYPPGIGRGGIIEVYYRFGFQVSLTELPGEQSSGTEVSTRYSEAIDPHGGGIPDKQEFRVTSYFDNFDPYHDIEDALTTNLRD